MTKSLIRLTTLALLSTVIAASPSALTTAYAAGSDTPSSPPPSDQKKGSKDKKHNETKPDDRAFLDGYRAVYDKHDYTSAITQLKALKQDDRADVANLIGYSYRKLGDYKVSQAYYERALKADPNHARTWQYYGLWQVEQGNRDQAQYHLNKLASLTGMNSAEYKSLADALAQTPGTGLTY
jgi:tetratricopeptide (TPR) repeat protein